MRGTFQLSPAVLHSGAEKWIKSGNRRRCVGSHTARSCLALCAYFFSVLKDLLTSEISPPPDSEETNRVHFDFKCKGELRKEQELATYGLGNQMGPEEGRVCLMELSDVTGTSCSDAQVAGCDSETESGSFCSSLAWSLTDLVLFFSDHVLSNGVESPAVWRW